MCTLSLHLVYVSCNLQYAEAVSLWNFLPRQEETSDSYVYGRITLFFFLPNFEIKAILKDELAL